jgi:hypothetical protein
MAPYLCGFPSRNLYNAAATAYIDVLRLADAALGALSQCKGPDDKESPYGEVLQRRYFDIDTPGVREKVVKVFKAIKGPSPFFTGPAEKDEPGFELELWYESVPPWAAGNLPPECTEEPDTAAYTQYDETEPRKAFIGLCPILFAGGRPEKLNSIKCSELSDTPSKQTAFPPGCTLVHEFTHWGYMMFAQAGFQAIDWNTDPFDKNVEPTSGYGP